MRGGEQSFEYVPALDGVRALAVAAVIAFHAGASWAPGGFLGVSVFFTLSGYLITTLLLLERRRGGIDLPAFWGRRLRRLLPASLVCLGGVLATAFLLTDPVQRRRVPGDVVAAVADVANWRFIFDSQSYAQLFARPSPVQHFWSLAIEEQSYLILPVVIVLVLGHRSERWLAGVLVLGIAASLAACLATSDHNLAYYGTHIRIGELLAGSLLAVTLLGRSPAPKAATLAGTCGLLSLAVMCAVTSGVDTWLSRGGFLLVAAASAAVLVGVMHGPLIQRLVGCRPLAFVGRISYGLYLYHWPVFVLLDEHRTSMTGLPLVLLRLAVTVAIALGSYFAIELPVRQRQVWSSVRAVRSAAVLGVVGVVIAAMVIPVAGADPGASSVAAIPVDGAAPIDFDAELPTSTIEHDGGLAHVVALSLVGAATAAGSVSIVRPVVRPVSSPAASPVASQRVLVLGSVPSVAVQLRTAGVGHIDAEVVGGCPIAPAVRLSLSDGTEVDTAPCSNLTATWPDLVKAVGPDVVVVAIGPLERGIRQRIGDTGFPADAAEQLRREEEFSVILVDAIDAIASISPRTVLWDSEALDDPTSRLLDQVQLRHPDTAVTVHSAAGDFAPLIAAVSTRSKTTDTRLRVMVVGDSTSFGFAEGLHDVASEQLHVLWAGQVNCPLDGASEIRWWPGAEWGLDHCRPYTETWPEQLVSFRPDLVIAVDSLGELAEQRYPPDTEWHVPGDEAWHAHHVAEMAAMLQLLAPLGIPMLIADAPPITAGMFAGGSLADPARLQAWNAQIAEWDRSYDQVLTLQLAGRILSYETEHPDCRPDGVHLGQTAWDELARLYLVEDVMAVLDDRPVG